jgi:hypothetical protein
MVLRLISLYSFYFSIHLPKNEVTLSVIIEEKYCEIWIIRDENCPGFMTIVNRFHIATHQHSKQVM